MEQQKMHLAVILKSDLQSQARLILHCFGSTKASVTTSTTVEVTVFSSFKDDRSYQFLTAGNSKMVLGTKRNRTFGVGPNVSFSDPDFGTRIISPIFYGAVVNESFYLFIQ
jgi:hypothetical protein